MIRRSLFFLLISILTVYSSVYAQDDLMDIFGEEEATDYATASFKTYKVVLGQSVKNPAEGNLVFVIQHQFGLINGGAYELWGLDQSTIRIGLDYGLTDWWAVGLGRSNFNKTFDGSSKIRILRQSSGKKNMPITLSYFAGMYINSLKWEYPERENYFSSRLSYTHQILVARKFSDRLTLQFSPTAIHRNLVETVEEEHTVLSVGTSGRFKLNKWMSVNAEYFYLLPGYTSDNFYDSFSVGIDLETGGHVFQLFLTNSLGIQEPYFIAETTGQWGKGDLHFSFNIHRNFVLKKHKTHKANQ